MGSISEDRLEELFEAATTLPPEKRAAFVEEACAEDLDLRAELLSLLEHVGEAQQLLEQAVRPAVTDAATALVGEPDGPADEGVDPLVGRRVGHYRILDRLGGGGMGVVYAARDLTLDRPVALKFLPFHLSSDDEARARLVAEAKAASALDHPNICTIYEIGEIEPSPGAARQLFIAMAYYTGATLKEKLRDGPLPVDEAVDCAVQIAEGLVRAHEAGIVHRDIKPANLMVTEHGELKILDFGLAKRADVDTTAGGVVRGAVPGTLAYMSPEQTRGGPVDARTDIWSLGVVLYQMLAGVRPFRAEDVAALIQAIRRDEPEPLELLRPEAPDAVTRVVERCLRKEPRERYAGAGALLEELGGAPASDGFGGNRLTSLSGGGVTPTGTAPAVAPIARPGSRTMVMAGVTLAVAVLGFLAWATLHSGPPRLTVSNVRQITRAPEPELDPVLSPNGQEVAYAAGWGNQLELFVQDVRGGRAFPLTQDVPGRQYGPRWTPDGGNIAFQTVDSRGGRVWSRDQAHSSVIPRLGGPATMLAEGRVWDFLGDAIVYTAQGSLLVRDSAGVAPRVLVTAPRLHSARFSPDGRHIAFVEGNSFYLGPPVGNVGPSGIRIVSTAGGDMVPVTTDLHMNMSPAWLPDGRRLLFVSDRDGSRDIYLVHLAPDGWPIDDPRRVTTGLDPHTIGIATGGSAVVLSRLFLRRNVWAVEIPERGSISVSAARPVTIGNQRVENHGVSADGAWLLFDADREGNQDIFMMPVGGGELQRLTQDPADDFHPDLSPDSRTLAFYSTRFGSRDLLVMDVTGGGVSRLTRDATEEAHPAFSPDGNAVAFEMFATPDSAHTIMVIRRVGSGAAWSPPKPIGAGRTPRWSPDGDHLVYQADRGIVIATLEGGERLLVPQTREGFAWPHWGVDGAIYFWGTDGSGQDGILAVSPNGGPPRLVVRLDDPRFHAGYGLSVSRNTLFMTLTEYESDIWSMDLNF